MDDDDDKGEQKHKDFGLWRDLTSYWMLGLCNKCGYVVMLTAAYDILEQFHKGNEEKYEHSNIRDCHYISTGAILLANILPSMIAKFLMPFVPFWVNIRVAFAVLCQAGSFVLVGFATEEWMAYLGVALTSAATGIGESTIIAYSSSFNKNVISTWSSGTGGSGILGSLSYTSFIFLGLTARDTMLIMVSIPILEALVFWLLLRKPGDAPTSAVSDFTKEELAEDEHLETVKEKIFYIKYLTKYMIPLVLVYYFQYFINQGLYELVHFKNIFIDHAAQYRWLNMTYQIGVFISRSSVNLLSFPYLYLLAALQLLNVVYFITEVVTFVTPTVWIVFAMSFWEGVVGGGSYVNTFYRMAREIPPKKRRYALGIVIQSDSFGILLAGMTALPVHNFICARAPLIDRN